MRFQIDRSLVLVVDIQARFMASVENQDVVHARALFVTKCASILGVPVFATEQNPSRLGETDPAFAKHLASPPSPKMTFSAWGPPPLVEAVLATKRDQIILVGVESHICITQTALDLVESGFHVAVVADAVGSRLASQTDIAFPRLRHAGAEILHSESLVYEWLRTAEHPRFKEVLTEVKLFALLSSVKKKLDEGCIL